MRPANSASRSPARARACGSRSSPISWASGHAVNSACAWPPRPSVQSTRMHSSAAESVGGASRAGASSATTSASMTGTCSSARPLIRHLDPSDSVLYGESSCRGVSTRDPRGVLPGTGEVVSGSRTCGLKPPYTSSIRLLLLRASASWEHVLIQFGKCRLLLSGVLLPCGGVPDLHAFDRPHHATVLIEACVRPQMRRDRDPALLIRYLVGGSRSEHSLVVPDVLLAGGGAPRGFGHVDKRTDRPNGQASLLESGDHQAVS